MRLVLFFIVVTITQTLALDSYSQTAKLSLDFKNEAIVKILDKIEDESEFYFMYDATVVDVNQKRSINCENKTITKILNELFQNTEITYKIDDRQIALSNTNKNLEKSQSESNQQQTVSGKVTDSGGSPLPGVTVVVQGTTQGTITDADGNYTLSNVFDEATLVFSFVGMKSQEIPVAGKTTVNVTMAEDVVGIEEVVAVGYGSQKKVNLTGSIVSLNGEDLTNRKVAQTSLALQGIAPGVVVTQRSGQPGFDAGTIRIRGNTTLGNNNPLILVDGVEMGLNNIDPTVIESISILKDAASASIYGSRAANGVILVTTKRAQKNKLSVSYNGYVGWQKPTNLPDMVGAIDHMLLINEAYENVGTSPLYSDAYIQEYRNNMASDPDRYPDTDWFGQVVNKSGFMQNHTLTMNGGTETVRVMASFGYLEQNGIMANTNYKRYNMRINTDLVLTKSFSAQIDAVIKQGKTTSPSRGANGAIHWAGRIPANQGGVLSSGLWGEGWNGDNPIAFTRDGGLGLTEMPSFALNLILKYQPVDWLNVDVAYSPNYWQYNESDFEKAIQTYSYDGSPSYISPSLSKLEVIHNRNLHNNIRSTLNIERTFGNSNFKLLAGYQQEDYRNDQLEGYREVFTFPEYTVLNAGGEENQKAYGTASEWALQSFFGRLNYSLLDRYLLEANIRYDGSSRFAEGHKWGTFPSFSAGWRISEEAFFSSLKNVVNNLKFRASWGKLGNQNIGNYPFASSVELGIPYMFNDQASDGAAVTTLANALISWETTTETDIGLDLTLKDRLTLVADYYYKKTDDILLTLDIPPIIGMNAPTQNAGQTENRGWELGLNYRNWDNEFKYDISFNISDVKNKILDLKGLEESDITVNHEGYPMNSIYGLEADGFITEADFDASGNYLGATQFGDVAPGDIKYIDQDNDEVINDNDYKIIGETIPRYTFGFNFNANYKNFDFSLFLQGVGKADGLIYGQGIMPFYVGGTVQEQHKDRWTPNNPDATFPRFAFNANNNEQISSFWMRDAAYVRLKNLQVGYTLPQKISDKIGLQQLRVYVNGQNLMTISDFWKGYDVEAPVGNGGYYPQEKTFNIGVDVKF